MHSLPKKKWILPLLAAVNIGNYLDRQLIYSLFPILKAEFQTSDFQLGLLGTGFMLTHAVATIPFGILADRWSKPKLITVGMVFWSLFTFISGLSRHFYQLFIARGLIGIGGATFEPAAVSLITENYDESYRGRALGIVKTGMWVGGMAGLILGGVLGTYIGWRYTLFLAALPGFVLAFFTWNISGEKMSVAGQKTDGHKDKIFDWSGLVILIIIGGIFVTYSSGAFIAWVITFIVRYDYFELSTAAVLLGGVATVSGVAGILVGSTIADLWHQKNKGGRMLTVAFGMLFSIPFICLSIYAPNRIMVILGVSLGTFFMAWYHGPIMAVLMDVVAPATRGAMIGAYLFFIHMFGAMPAPAVVGIISDMSNLRIGLLTTVLGNLLCAFCFFIAFSKLKRSRK
ncbi:MAG: MFS transporter [Candidatus Marinimicrobia bacterium]|nr:MFS transporter [Candidatus Neomarinimicrobiota bacterium]MCH8069919.1 MFS transporter [Candidatus Neomarinimicrobiota bacterium]